MTRFPVTPLAAVVVVAALGVSLFALRNTAHPTKPAQEPEAVPDFALLDQAGRLHQLSRYATARAVVLYSHSLRCATTPRDVAALHAVRRAVVDPGVAYLMLDADPAADRDAPQHAAERLGIDMAILQDDSQLVAETLRIRQAGEVLLLEPGTWRVVYRGPIEAAGRSYLADALRAFLDGRRLAGDVPPVAGCALAAAGDAGGEVSYAGDVVPVLRAKCVACHRTGGIAPWAMDGYDRVKAWSPRIRAVLLTGRMPPWHADPRIGRFSPDRSLTVDQKRRLIHWIDAGAPRSAGDDPLAAQPPAAEEWPLGKPDVVVELPVQDVPATGTAPYRYIRVPAPVAGDRWVRAVHVKPTNPAVVHHVLLFLEYPAHLKEKQPEWHEGAASFFAVYAPGYQPLPFPAGSGGFLPADTTLLFQLHYTPIGRETTDVPKLALYFHAKPPALEYRVSSAVNAEFRVPPGDSDHAVQASHVFDRSVVLHGLMPHMHFRGKRFRYEARYPDGRTEPLLSVPRYDFNWQTQYDLATPKPLPAGTRVVVDGAFDNSGQNPANPDPSQEVRWGHQSWDEMFIGYLMYTTPVGPHPADRPAPHPHR